MKMLSRGLYLICAALMITSVTALSTANSSSPEANPPLPADLQNLLRLWEKVPREARIAVDVWKLEARVLDEGQELEVSSYARRSLEEIEKIGGQVLEVMASFPREGSRQLLIKLLNPRREAQLFCEAMVLGDYTPKPGQRLSGEQLLARKELHRFNQCRKNIKTIFAGIFYADQRIIVVNVRYRIGTVEKEQLQVIIPSLVDARQILTYRIAIR